MHVLLPIISILSLSISTISTPIVSTTEIIASKLNSYNQLDSLAKDYSNRVIMIRHGEKKKDQIGLSRAGKMRAQCLRKVFGITSEHNIGLILVESYNPNSGKRMRPFLTVGPLADDLGLEINLDCERDDAACVRAVVKEFTRRSTKDVLICWKHSELANIAYALGASGKTPYPNDRFDIMWILQNQKFISKKSERCKGLDDHRKDSNDRHLTIDESIESAEEERKRIIFEQSLSLQQKPEDVEEQFGEVEYRDWEEEGYNDLSQQILLEGREVRE